MFHNQHNRYDETQQKNFEYELVSQELNKIEKSYDPFNLKSMEQVGVDGLILKKSDMVVPDKEALSPYKGKQGFEESSQRSRSSSNSSSSSDSSLTDEGSSTHKSDQSIYVMKKVSRKRQMTQMQRKETSKMTSKIDRLENENKNLRSQNQILQKASQKLAMNVAKCTVQMKYSETKIQTLKNISEYGLKLQV